MLDIMANLLYIMCFFGDTPKEGDFFYDPENYHITLLPEFSVPDENLAQFLESLQPAETLFQQISVNETKAAFLGDDFDIPVVKVQSTSELELPKLHAWLMERLAEAQGTPDTKYVLERFSPHISFKPFTGASYMVTGFSVIHHQVAFGEEVKNIGNYMLKS